MTDKITILEAKGTNPYKTYQLQPDGSIEKTKDYDHIFQVRPHVATINGFESLATGIEQVAENRACFIIRGEPIEYDDLDETDWRRRLKHPKDDDPAYFQDAEEGRRWLAFDLDDIPAPDGFAARADRQEARRRAVKAAIRDYLPDCFAVSSCVAQWTGSAGVYGWDELRLRLWYWGDRRVCWEALDDYDWHEAVDRSIWRNCVQPVYTARPKFEDFDGEEIPSFDFDEDRPRTFRIEGARDTVEFPEAFVKRSEYDGNKRSTTPVEDRSGDVTSVSSRTQKNQDLDKAQEALEYIDGLGRDEWVRLGIALKVEFGDDGWPMFRQKWETLDPNYPGDDVVRKQWDSFGGQSYSDGVTMGTFFHYAKEGGWPGELTPQRADEILETCENALDFMEPAAIRAAARLQEDLGKPWAELVGRVKRFSSFGDIRFTDWEKTVTKRRKEIVNARKRAAVRQEKQQEEQEDTHDRPITNFVREIYGEEPVRFKKPLDEIVDDIFEVTGQWPRMMDNVLFAPSYHEDGPRFFEKEHELFAWLQSQGEGVEWTGRDVCSERGKIRPHGKKEVASELQDRVDKEHRYQSVETIPHVPPVDNAYYFDRELPEATGEALEKFLSFFNPATEIDGQLIECKLMSGMAGLAPGKRPAFVITSDHGRGSGKSSTAQAISRVFGGAIGIKAQDGWDQLQQRLLDPSTADKRFCMIDNLKNRLSSAEFESAITDRTINGKRMYVGDGERVNLLTWVFTANTPSLSNDLASRSVVIKIGNADHSFDFDAAIDEFLAERRDELLADIKARLEEEPKARVSDRYADRWQAWQRAVLTRFDNANEIARTIAERRREVDDDIAIAEEWARATREVLEEAGHDPDTVKTVVPSTKVVEIARSVEHNPTIGYQQAWDAYRDIQGCGGMKNTKKYTSSPRGMLWVGPEWVVNDGITKFQDGENNSPGGGGGVIG